jgi:hypothetical protein
MANAFLTGAFVLASLCQIIAVARVQLRKIYDRRY